MFRQKVLTITAIVISVFSPTLVAIAQTPPSPGGGGTNSPPSPGTGLDNPLRSDSLMELLQEILDVIMVFAVPLIVFMIIYAGFLYVTARGNETQVTNASRALLYAVIGGVIILGANIILAVISGTVDAFR